MAPPISKESALRLVRAQLAGQLKSAEIDKLLSNQQITNAVVEAFAQYDGIDDHFEITVSSERLLMRVVTGERHRECTLDRKSELAVPQMKCQEWVERQTDHTLEADKTAWRVPPQPQPVVKRPAAKPSPKAPPAPETPTPQTVLKNPPSLSSQVRQCLATPNTTACHQFWLAQAGGPVSPGAARTMRGYVTFVDDARRALNDPFLRTGVAVRRSPGETVSLETPDAACLHVFRSDTGDLIKPPTLDCYLQAVYFNRVEKSTAITVLDIMSQVLMMNQLTGLIGGLLGAIRDQVTAGKQPTRGAVNMMWALTWMESLQQRPDWTADAIAQLGPSELQALRSFIHRWWQNDAYARYRPLMTTLLQEHFCALYPEAKLPSGAPNRQAFANDYLWASNWMAVHQRATAAIIEQRFEALAPADQQMLMQMHRYWGSHFVRVAKVLAHYVDGNTDS